MNTANTLRRSFLWLCALICCATASTAQLSTHVEWTASIEKISATQGELRLTAHVEDGWHIYGTTMPVLDDQAGVPDPTTLVINPAQGLVVEDADAPAQCSIAPSEHFDDLMQLNLPWLAGTFTLSRRFSLAEGTSGASVSGYVSYMACNDSQCTPPTRYEFSLKFGDASAIPMEEEAAEEEPGSAVSLPYGVGSGVPAATLEQWWAPVEMDADASTQGHSYWYILIFGFLGGLLALLTPCVWPMIPMTVSFFLKGSKSRARAIRDASLYSFSIVAIFLLLGIVITLIFGPGKLNEIATSAVFNVIFFLLLVVFALSFLGAFEITLPSKWSNAIDEKAETTTGFVSIFFMAFTLVLVSFSCTGPIIGTLLVEAFSEGSLLGPLVGMAAFALGLALPFGLFAFFPSMLKELPRSGSWLNTVKVVLGFIELILSLKFLSVADLAYGWGILDREIFLCIWIVLFVLLGMYLLGKLHFPHDTPGDGRTGVGRFVLAVCSLSFAVYLVPGLWGAPLKGISAFAPPLYTQDFNLYGGEFHEFDNYEEGMEYAASMDMPVLLDFSGYACVNCRKMEGAVFDTPAVRTMIEENYVMIKLMVDDKTALPEPVKVEESGQTVTLRTVGDKWSYLQRHKFGINSQPYYVLLDNEGQPLAPSRAYDENIDAFLEWLQEGVNAR